MQQNLEKHLKKRRFKESNNGTQWTKQNDEINNENKPYSKLKYYQDTVHHGKLSTLQTP